MQPKASLSQKFRKLSLAQSECTIYRVYGHLRNINSKAYEPEVIAIGPYHHGKDNLEMMEDHKLVCFRRLLDRKNQNVETYLSAISPLGEQARKYYGNTISVDAPTEFIEMLILDGCFIIQLVRKQLEDPFFKMPWINHSLHRDLMLFENQIPFFVLCELFDLIERPNQHGKLMGLLTEYYRLYFPEIKMSSNISSHEIKHLLGLIYVNLVSSFDWSVLLEDTNDQGEDEFVGAATSLTEANVKFKINEESSMFGIRFERGTLYLPHMLIDDATECLLRNLIAYEQYFPSTRTFYVSDYLKFLDYLINSPKDVQILSRAGILKNGLGDDTAVADIFNKLTDSIMVGTGDGFTYSKIIRMVNEHCKKRRNRWMAKLRRDYLNSPWAIISVIAATILLLLTVAQTVFSVL